MPSLAAGWLVSLAGPIFFLGTFFWEVGNHSERCLCTSLQFSVDAALYWARETANRIYAHLDAWDHGLIRKTPAGQLMIESRAGQGREGITGAASFGFRRRHLGVIGGLVIALENFHGGLSTIIVVVSTKGFT
ncbi:hypothetical protein B0H17DRAFT_1127009 [Mycena rosella]|uniref:Uncharacterized protein n=1 Tax=Mycena rosella TaxID=1033263 RepID=A0AAD7GRZ5_MYCRO|nr:hypothetical protein B0H17DRAFT_1127009 [Mycena rosella]